MFSAGVDHRDDGGHRPAAASGCSWKGNQLPTMGRCQPALEPNQHKQWQIEPGVRCALSRATFSLVSQTLRGSGRAGSSTATGRLADGTPYVRGQRQMTWGRPGAIPGLCCVHEVSVPRCPLKRRFRRISRSNSSTVSGRAERLTSQAKLKNGTGCYRILHVPRFVCGSVHVAAEEPTAELD